MFAEFPFTRLIVAIATGALAAASAYPALTWKRPARNAALVTVMFLVAISPLLVPSSARPARLVATLFAVAMLVKVYDVHVGASDSGRPSFRTFLINLFNWFCLVLRRCEARPRGNPKGDLRVLALAFLQVGVVFAACWWVFRRSWENAPFIVEHLFKAGTVFLLLIPLTAIGSALWRLAGGAALEFMDRPLLAATPAEFWRRYNRPAQQLLYEDVFKLCGGRRAPMRATFLTFAASALVHEYVFGIVIGRVQGYQTLFFLIQGMAVMATLRWRLRGWKKWTSWAGTFAFNVVTSVLFFASVNEVVPFYSRPLPWPVANW